MKLLDLMFPPIIGFQYFFDWMPTSIERSGGCPEPSSHLRIPLLHTLVTVGHEASGRHGPVAVYINQAHGGDCVINQHYSRTLLRF